jgi:arylsulfatase A-like enzyme
MLRLWIWSALLLCDGGLVTSVNPPNILLLTTDQQRLDTMGCYGSRFAKSPNIDQLASQGVRYTESYTASPTCMSARASWISGTQVPVHNVWGNGINQLNDAGTIVAPLKQAGYFTAIIGKTHYDPVPAFDYQDIHSGNLDKRKPNTHSGHFLETYLVNQAKKLLQNEIQGAHIAKNKPWFVHLSFISPHPPSNVPLEWQGMYKNVTFPKVKFGGPQEWAQYPRQLKGFMPGKKQLQKAFPDGKPDEEFIFDVKQKYYELSNYVDFQVGRMLDFLDKQNLAHNTLVIFTSDHGTNNWDHGFDHKFNFFDGSWRVSLIMRGPGVPKGTTQEFAAGVDVPATIIAAARAKRPTHLNGLDLITPLMQKASSPRTHGVAGALLQGLAVVTREWKLTFYLDDGNGQLFHRSSDPHELHNLFHEPRHLHVKNSLLTALLRWRSGLEPLKFMQQHNHGPFSASDAEWVYEYTTNLTGMEPEMELQRGLAAPSLQGVVFDKMFV